MSKVKKLIKEYEIPFTKDGEEIEFKYKPLNFSVQLAMLGSLLH